MADETRPAPGAASALLGYGALLLGFFAIGVVTQQRDVIVGLWVTEALAIALPAVIAVRAAGFSPARYLGLRAPTAWQLVVAAALALLNQPVVTFLTWAARSLSPPAWVEEFDALQRVLDAVFAQNAIPMIATVAVAAPLGEELFFRGYALPAFARSWGSLAAVLLTGAMFSALHLNKIGFVGLWEIGIMLALLRLWSGSLWPSVLCHAMNNALAGAAFLLGWEDPSVPPSPLLLAAGALLSVGGVVLAVRVLRNFPREQLALTAIAQERAQFDRLWTAGLVAIWILAVALGVAQTARLLPPLPTTGWISLSAAAILVSAAPGARAATR
ncbi:MAG TPA: CPBP family intramembrane glutamic endopeptidase [Myxococcales bacterium]|nr:CPBP family intramembrane glutamic endopeptidase [Myxococcales bacterium]